jgi:hypothetical protein
MRKKTCVIMSAALVCGAVAAAALAQPTPDPVPAQLGLATDMAEAGRRFLATLTPAQRARAVFPVEGDERGRWHYVPMSRPGIALKELGEGQRALAYGLLATALDRRGFLKASGVLALEDLLRRRDNSALRDPGAYVLAVFGAPSASSTWGFRVEGHHLSLNLTLVDGVRPVASPTFFGASPATTPAGNGFLADTRVLGREEDLGFRLLASLDAAQRKAATYQVAAPDDILTGPGRKLTTLPGLTAERMTPPQRQLLEALLDEVTTNLPREVGERERARVATYRPADLVFTWAGGGATGQPHYFRISGPSFVYELDNTQAGANHVHTVWHAREASGGDFGADLLRQHRAQFHAGPERPADR